MLQRGRGIAGVAGNTLSLKRIWKPNANIMAATVAHSVRPRKHTTPYLENETTATLHKTHAALPPNINVTLKVFITNTNADIHSQSSFPPSVSRLFFRAKWTFMIVIGIRVLYEAAEESDADDVDDVGATSGNS